MLCSLLGRSRQAYYGQFRAVEREAFQSELLIQEVSRIRERQKRIGVRKLYYMTGGFREEHGIRIGRDAFFDLMREEGMLVRRRQSRKPRTTISQWNMKWYPNLIRDFEPWEANLLWVSDITYVRVGAGFCYLSLVTDAYSRKIVGFALREDLTAKGSIEALSMAMRNNPHRRNLIHHSDRGLQYYSSKYMRLLGDAEVRVSMSEKSDPLENAIAERVNGILKDELLQKSFRSFTEARREVARAVSIYNNLRPHLSVDMLTPVQAHARSGELKRRWKNYRSNRRLVGSPQASA